MFHNETERLNLYSLGDSEIRCLSYLNINHFILILSTSVICWRIFFTSSGSFVEWGRATVMMIIMMCLRVFNPSPSLWWLVEDSCGRSSDHKSKDQLRFKSRAVVFRFEKKMKKKNSRHLPSFLFQKSTFRPFVSPLKANFWMFFPKMQLFMSTVEIFWH